MTRKSEQPPLSCGALGAGSRLPRRRCKKPTQAPNANALAGYRRTAWALLARALFVLLFGWSSELMAQGFVLSRYNPPQVGGPFAAVMSPFLAAPWAPAGAALVDYAYKPLVVESDAGLVRRVVSHQAHLHLGASVSLLPRLAADINVPLALYQAGDNPTLVAGEFRSPDSAQLGDIRVGLRLRVIGDHEDDSWQAALGAMVWLPSGADSKDSFVGSGDARAMPMVLLGGRQPWGVWAASGGVELRPSTTYAGTSQGSMAHLGAAAGFDVDNARTLQWGPELTLATVVRDLSRENFNSELLVSARWRFLGSWVLSGGAGPGLSSGIGTPAFRGLLGLSWVPQRVSDRDGDGIDDPLDACADARGEASSDSARHGCPRLDADDDGIEDAADACPNAAGPSRSTPEANGCPDTDGDTVLDLQDACPEQPGSPSRVAAENGCPSDQDGDGVVDGDDACPATPGLKHAEPTLSGCPPDRDGDGVIDLEDACPAHAGPRADEPARNGCPDRDGDAIADLQDACPDEPGPSSPEPSKHGCPTVRVTEQEVLILERVEFETGKATIVAISFPLLDAIAGVLTAHPELVRVEVQGHTDDRGPRWLNRRLSQQRAEAVAGALQQRGVSAARLLATGYGPDKPLESNESEAGRSVNRRVQIKILERAAQKETR